MKKFFMVFIFLSVSGCLLADDSQEKINALPEAYRELGRGCLKTQSFNCCMASVHYMAGAGAVLREPGQKACLPGYRGDMLKCEGSYAWCEPELEGTRVPALKVEGVK